MWLENELGVRETRGEPEAIWRRKTKSYVLVPFVGPWWNMMVNQTYAMIEISSMYYT